MNQKEQMDKLNLQQQRKLRAMFAGRGKPETLYVDEQISKVSLSFDGKVTHFIIFGPRGGIVYHDQQWNGFRTRVEPQ